MWKQRSFLYFLASFRIEVHSILWYCNKFQYIATTKYRKFAKHYPIIHFIVPAGSRAGSQHSLWHFMTPGVAGVFSDGDTSVDTQQLQLTALQHQQHWGATQQQQNQFVVALVLVVQPSTDGWCSVITRGNSSIYNIISKCPITTICSNISCVWCTNVVYKC